MNYDNEIKQLNESNLNYLESIISKENIKNVEYYSSNGSLSPKDLLDASILILDITFIYLGNRFAWYPYNINYNEGDNETYIHHEWYTQSEKINKDIIVIRGSKDYLQGCLNIYKLLKNK